MRPYFDVIFNIFSFSLSNPAIYYPLLITLSFSIIGAVAFIIRYLIRGSF